MDSSAKYSISRARPGYAALHVTSTLSMGRNEFPMTQKRPRLPGSDETSDRRLADDAADGSADLVGHRGRRVATCARDRRSGLSQTTYGAAVWHVVHGRCFGGLDGLGIRIVGVHFRSHRACIHLLP